MDKSVGAGKPADPDVKLYVHTGLCLCCAKYIHEVFDWCSMQPIYRLHAVYVGHKIEKPILFVAYLIMYI